MAYVVVNMVRDTTFDRFGSKWLPAPPDAVVSERKSPVGRAGVNPRGGAGVDLPPGGTGDSVPAGVCFGAAVAACGQVIAWTPDNTATSTSSIIDMRDKSDTCERARYLCDGMTLPHHSNPAHPPNLAHSGQPGEGSRTGAPIAIGCSA